MIRSLAGTMFLLLGLCAIALAGKASSSTPARQKHDFSQFITLDANGHFVNEHGPFIGYGVHYCQTLGGNNYYEVGDYDLAQMAADLDALATRGMTNVTLRVFWGVYVNAATRAKALDRWGKVLDLVQAHGLYASIWFDPVNSWPTQIPYEQRYEVALRQANWDLFLEHVRDFTGRYKDRKCIMAYNVNNEAVTQIYYETLNAQLPELLQRYQTFITQKYGTIQQFNAKWGTAYVSFQAIPLPTFNVTNAAFLGKEEQLVEYNYFRERFLTQRCQEAAAAIRGVAPNHLLMPGQLSGSSGIAALFEFTDLDRFTNYDILSSSAYPGDSRDGGFYKSFQSILMCLKITRPFKTFVRPAHLSENGIFDNPSGVRVSSQQMADWTLTSWADLVGDGALGMDIWDYITFAYPNRTSKPDPNGAQFTEIGKFTDALAGLDVKFAAPVPEVLILRNKAVNNSTRSTWLDQGNYMAIGDWLYQLHVPFDVRTEADIDQTILGKYKVIVLCDQTALYDDAFYAMMRSWAEGAPGRVIVGGMHQLQDAWFQPKSRCADMKYLTGIPSDGYSVPWHGVTGETLGFVFKQPFGTLAKDDRVTFTLVAQSWDIPKPLAATTEVIAEISSKPGTPLLIRNTLSNGNKVYTFGVPPGLVWWSVDGEPGPVLHDGMVPIYRQMLADAGVVPAFEAPTSLGVYVTSDKSGILFKDRYATPTDAIFTGDLGGSVYDTASCDVEASGKTTLHSPVRAHGYLVARRLPVVLAPQSGVTKISNVATAPDRASFSLSGPAKCGVTVSGLLVKASFKVLADGRTVQNIHSDDAGQVVFTMPAGSHTVSLITDNSRVGRTWDVYR